MEFEHSEKVRALQARVTAFMAEQIYPNEEDLFAQVSEGDAFAKSHSKSFRAAVAFYPNCAGIRCGGVPVWKFASLPP